MTTEATTYTDAEYIRAMKSGEGTRIPELISYLSSIVALEPGDIISTGTPSGVGLGRTPQRWLQPGEEMIVEIERIGALRNRTRAIDWKDTAQP